MAAGPWQPGGRGVKNLPDDLSLPNFIQPPVADGGTSTRNPSIQRTQTMKADGSNRRQQNIGATKDNVTQKKGKGYALTTSVSRPTVTNQPRRKQPDVTETTVQL